MNVNIFFKYWQVSIKSDPILFHFVGNGALLEIPEFGNNEVSAVFQERREKEIIFSHLQIIHMSYVWW